MIVIILAILGVVLDLGTKSWAVSLKGEEPIIILENLFKLDYLENTGAAFSIFSGNTTFLILMSIVVAAGILCFYIKYRGGNGTKLLEVATGMIIGGALGNFYDRIVQGYVIDFISVHYKDVYYFPTFNVADILVVVGTFFLCIYILKYWDVE